MRFGSRRSVTRHTTPDEDATIKLHSHAVAPLDLKQVLNVLADEPRRRLIHLLQELEVAPSHSKETAPVTVRDATQLLSDGIIATIPRSDILGWTTPFSVREDKADGPRRRFILWPKHQNEEVYERGFTSSTTMQHVSSYLHPVSKPFGLTRDLKVGFWQVALSDTAARCFCFSDASGQTYKMLRLPMGHSCSVDIQEIITGAIAGSIAYCRPDSALPGPVPDIWVDGARWAGTKEELSKVAADVDQRAKSLSATWKEFDQPSSVYDFIGVNFNHDASTVRVADKTRAKIPDECPPKISPRALEQLVGRLLFAAGIAGIPLARHYFAIKWCRRIFNRANWSSSWLEPVSVPRSARTLLTSWCKDCVLERKWFEPHGRGEAYLFTDATPSGWGAVVMTSSNKVFATGGHIHDTFDSINSTETLAVRFGVEAFFNILSSVDKLHIVVDNTSAPISCRARLALLSWQGLSLRQ